MALPTEPAPEPQPSGFACVCVQKTIEFDITDQKLHRAAKDKELHEELEKLTSAGPSSYAYQLGGGCRVVHDTGDGHGKCASSGAPAQHIVMASCGETVAAFQGTLNNHAELVEALMGGRQAAAAESGAAAAVEASPPAAEQAEQVGAVAAAASAKPECGASVNEAEVICRMYTRVGVQLLGSLRGQFTFCMYDAKSGRVLAARAGGSPVPLFQALSPAESLVIASHRSFVATTCSDVKEILPGHFKYGWHAEPRPFDPREFLPGGHHHGHHHPHHHHGHHHSHHQHGHGRGQHRRNSLSGPHMHQAAAGPGTPQQAARVSHSGSSGSSSSAAAAGSPRAGSGRRVSMDAGQARSPNQHNNNNQNGQNRRVSMDVLPESQGAAKGKGKQAANQAGRKSMDGKHQQQGRKSCDESRHPQPGRYSIDTVAKPVRRSIDTHHKQQQQQQQQQHQQHAPSPTSPFKWDVKAPEFVPGKAAA
eukprot:CAMPEP_0202921720 /NCGR_PEP_ID=MMETSP1392-20130828/77544_1 /ASSEMBLY_ACC=CAM_ASM_000868 /TAXON_ID=225041 /ORGANISM="Chlamydomonas chlamydogama, Strain SAG 11-48b" /LENGTH=476 /DNA_ID=CAMNT_0049615309 /DNA_START=168 /DNA_END=1598 /DNA_ORIENTATION=+